MTRSWLAALVLAASLFQGQVFAQTPAAPPTIPVPLPKDVAFGRFIAEVRAHLATGDELVAQRDWVDAHPHFGFPREEIYGVIREDLSFYKTPPFDDALIDLAATVKGRNAKLYSRELQRVIRALDRAAENLKERQPNWPRFVAQVAIAVLRVAPDEYEDAVVKDRIVRPIGYQTARGFILQAERMIESVAVELSFANPEPLADIRSGLTQLKQGFVNVAAPKQPVLSTSEVAAIVSRIDVAAAKLN